MAEPACRNLQFHGFGLAASQADSRESAKILFRGVGPPVLGIAGINLNDFITIAGACIGDVNLERNIAGGRLCRLDPSMGIFESRVAEAVAEGEEWLAAEITVGAIRHRIVLESWEVGRSSIDGDRQP